MLLIIAVVMLHNMLGYAFGYGVGRALGLSQGADAHAVHRGGHAELRPGNLACHRCTSPAMPLAAVPGAVFSVWHNISGAVYANILARTAEENCSICHQH